MELGSFSFSSPRGKHELLERRKAERMPCETRLIGELVLSETGEVLESHLSDISRNGIGCTIAKSLAKYTRAAIHLKKSKASSTVVMISLNVVHCTAESNASWRIGCEFNEAIAPLLLDYLIS